ncbi:MAG TPA: Poxvirus G6 [Thioploca sp.]|nr:Poxvirus G6 [Thioploca sp.]
MLFLHKAKALYGKTRYKAKALYGNQNPLGVFLMGTNCRTYFVIFMIPFILLGCPAQPVVDNKQTIRNDPCWQHALKTYGTTAKTMTRAFYKEIADYQSLVEESLTARAEMIKLAKRLKDNIRRDKPLSGYDLDTLNRGLLTYLKLRKKLYGAAESHECWLNTSAETFEALGIEPISPENRLKGIMLSLSAALQLYDNYLLAISVFEEDDKLRRFLNERDSGYDIGHNELAKVTDSYNSFSNRERVRTAIKFYEAEVAKVSSSLQEDSHFGYLKLLIEQSASYNMTKSYSPLYIIGRKLDFFGAVTSDILYHLGNDGMNLFSQLFGDTIGLVETRTGKLYNRPDVLDIIAHRIKAGDILAEKTPFRLTDKFIPGYFGHAAIWIGTEVELKRLGIWNHPVVEKYHEQIQKAHSVVEALRPGIVMNSMSHFLNIDDIVILRNPKLDGKAIAERIILTLRQMGKEYDFNFDVETTDKLVCSELVYTVYTGIEWPTKKTLGRFTVSPDNIVSKALNDGPLKLVAFFHAGELVEDNPLELISQLMGDEIAKSPLNPR